MRQKILNFITIVMIIATLTLADFLLLCVDVVSYANSVANSDKSTNHKNIEFMAYFKDEVGNRVTSLDTTINNSNIKLCFEIAVKREGYFNGNINLGTSNFRFNSESLSSEVNYIDDHTINLNQINAGDTKIVEVKIDVLRDDKFNLSFMDLDSEISINGVYRDSSQKDIKINSVKTVRLNLVSPYNQNDSKAILDQKIITNKVLNYKGDKKRVIQIQVNSGLDGNLFPIKSSFLKIVAPKIMDKFPETVLVNSVDNLNSNGKQILEEDYDYNSEDGIVNIDIQNTPENNLVNWSKSGEDVITLTYIYGQTDDIENQVSKIDLQLNLFDKNNTVIDASNAIELDNVERDSVITMDIKQHEDSMYKGKLYAGISRDISYSTYVNVNLDNVANSINLVEKKETIEGQGLSYEFDSVYKNTKIKKDEMLDILGQDGIISILNAETGMLISSISKDTQVDENGYVNILYSNDIRKIEIKISGPKKVGKIELKNTKTINKVDADLARNSSSLKYGVNGKYISYDNETKLGDIVSTIELKETESTAKLELNKADLSAMTTNENVEFRVILQAKSEKDELFKNPIIRIELPEKFQNIDINSIDLIYEDELQIVSKNLNGNTIEIVLRGEQTKYKEEAIDGAILIINANLTTNKKVSTSVEKVNLTYTNENAINYPNSLGIGQDQKDINIISHVGIITVDKISDYGIEVINNEGNKVAKLKISDDIKNTEIRSEIINNVGTSINNVNILGTFPTKDAVKDINNIETKIRENLNIQGIDGNRVKIYYSDNMEATADLDNSQNLWTNSIQNPKSVKKYLVVIDKLDVYEEIDFSYHLEIPAGLEYNEVVKCGYDIYFTNADTGIRESLDFGELTLETGKGPVVDTTLKAYVGNSEANNVKEGDIVTYSVTVTNTGSEDAKDVKAVGKIPQNTAYVESNEMEYEMSDQQIEFVPFSTYEDVQNIGFDVQNLTVGDSVTKTYQVKINDETQGQVISNEILTTYGEANKKSNQVNSKIESGDLRLQLYSADNGNGVLQNSYLYRYIVTVKNATDKDKKNIKLNVNADDVIDIQEIFYISSDNESIVENENTYVEISELKAGEEIEVCIVIKSKVLTSGKNQKGMISVSAEEKNAIYYSNVEEVLVTPINLHMSMSSANSDSYVSEGETIEYSIVLKNNGKDIINDILVENKLSNKTTFMEVTKNGEILSEDGEYSKDSEQSTGEDIIKLNDSLNANEQAEYKVKVAVNKVPGNTESMEIKDKVSVYADGIEINSEEIKHILEPDNIDNEDNDNSNNDNDNDSGNNDNNSDSNENDQNQDDKNHVDEDNTQNKDDSSQNDKNNNIDSGNTNVSDINKNEKKKSISGVAWVDENENGIKDSGETLLSNLTVKLLNTKTNKFVTNVEDKPIEAKTNQDGFYSFDSVRSGEYIVIFEYDTSKYILTAYEKDGADSKNVSKVINKSLSIEGINKTVGATEIIKVNDTSISNINIGLQNAKNFDLKLDKYISKVVIQNSKGTSSKEYTNTAFAKAEIDAKLVNGTTAIVEYTMKVTNNGDTDAYVKKIVDYISKDYKFASDLNKDWYQSGGVLYNSSLANEKLSAGESKEIKLVVTKQMTENNTGLINNTAQIVESYNELGLQDTQINNDKGVADLILSIKTGQIATTVVLVLISIIVIASVTYIGAIYVLKRRLI